MPDFSDIPDEAVEAAGRAFFIDTLDPGEWDDLTPATRERAANRMRTALAAALPVLNTAKDSETATWIDVVIARLTAVGGPDVTGAVATLRSLAASLRGEQGE